VQKQLNGLRRHLGFGLSEPKQPCVTWCSRSPVQRDNFGGKDMPRHARRHSAMSCAKRAEQIEMPFGLWVVDLCGPNEACIGWGAHWCSVVNTVEPFMCGSDAEFLSYLLLQ